MCQVRMDLYNQWNHLLCLSAVSLFGAKVNLSAWVTAHLLKSGVETRPSSSLRVDSLVNDSHSSFVNFFRSGMSWKVEKKAPESGNRVGDLLVEPCRGVYGALVKGLEMDELVTGDA